MRILLIVDAYLPVPTSTAKLAHDLASSFVERSHHVTVVAPDDSLAQSISVDVEDGIEVLRIKVAKAKGSPKLIRAVREMRFSSLFWRRARQFFQKHRFDLIVFFSPTIFFGGLVLKLKRLYGCPAYLVIRDIFSQFMIDVDVVRENSWIHRLILHKERQQYACADVIGVQSPGDLKYFGHHFQEEGYRLELLYNWIAANGTHHHQNGASHRERLGLQGKTVFFYGGNFGIAQDVDNILRLAAGLLDQPNIFFLLVGWGSCVPQIEAAVVDRKLTNVRLLPPVTQEEYDAMLGEFDVGLVSLDRRFKFNNIPGRVLVYLKKSLPILASVNPGNDLEKILEMHQAGFCFQNGEDEQFRQGALVLASSATLRQTLGKNGSSLLSTHFSAARTVEQILAHFPEYCGDSPKADGCGTVGVVEVRASAAE
jgi:glycosyltransferase involved in cell wall biosynthesis